MVWALVGLIVTKTYLRKHIQKIHDNEQTAHQQTEKVNQFGGVFVIGQPLPHQIRVQIVELAKLGTRNR